MVLIWKVGQTYHLCGEGSETAVHTAIAGESFRLFVPVFDIAEGIRFLSDDRSHPGVAFDLPQFCQGAKRRAAPPRPWLFREGKRPAGTE